MQGMCSCCEACRTGWLSADLPWGGVSNLTESVPTEYSYSQSPTWNQASKSYLHGPTISEGTTMKVADPHSPIFGVHALPATGQLPSPIGKPAGVTE